MRFKRELENYLLIDHRESPGLNEQEAAYAGFRGLPVGKGQRCEVPLVTCNHCQAQLIVNPLRTRARAYCPKCDRYICDQCEQQRVLTGICYPWKQREDDWWNSVHKPKIGE
jgi:hypothetical protein